MKGAGFPMEADGGGSAPNATRGFREANRGLQLRAPSPHSKPRPFRPPLPAQNPARFTASASRPRVPPRSPFHPGPNGAAPPPSSPPRRKREGKNLGRGKMAAGGKKGDRKGRENERGGERKWRRGEEGGVMGNVGLRGGA